jgi:type IX secretion system PorP/SprF family membrane protein
MKLKQLIVSAALVAASAIGAMAQDIHFSQFYMSPMQLNPAMTGVMNCNGRLMANYRNQWASVLKAKAFTTYSAAYDMTIPVGRADFFGGGLSLWGDRAGSLDFATMQGKLSLSYSKRMGGFRKQNHYLVVGAEGGLAQRSIDFLNARYGTQHSGEGSFDPNAASYENFSSNSFTFGDVGAGLLWFTNLDADNNFHIGAAAAHLNRANQSFVGDKFEGLYTKFTIHGGGEFKLSRKMSLVPNVAYFMQGPSYELTPGSALKFNLSKNRREYQAFQFGLWARLTNHYQSPMTPDAAILTTRFDYENLGLGFSYDINVSQLSPATQGNGGFELNLQYKICNGFNRPDYCPTF